MASKTNKEYSSDARVRLTLYTAPAKEFAVRYVALRQRKSVNTLLNELLDKLLQKENIDPATLQKALP